MTLKSDVALGPSMPEHAACAPPLSHSRAGSTTDDCKAGLSCDPVWRKCFPAPRKAGQPCAAPSDCLTGLYCNKYTKRCQAAGASVRSVCHMDDLPCLSTDLKPLSCDVTRNQCFPKPRVEDTPCQSTADCAAGHTCDTGVSNECHPDGVLNQECHEGHPCATGFSCHPTSPNATVRRLPARGARLEAPPAVHGHLPLPHCATCLPAPLLMPAPFPLPPPLLCPALPLQMRPGRAVQAGPGPGPRRRGGPGQGGGLPRALRLPPHPRRARPSASPPPPGAAARRKQGQPCDEVNDCDKGLGLTCDLVAGRCMLPGKEKEYCHKSRPCGTNLSCHPAINQCLVSPRPEGALCSTDAPELNCAAATPDGAPLTCDTSATMRCVRPQTYAKTSKAYGAHCYDTRPCGGALTCSTTSDMKASRGGWRAWQGSGRGGSWLAGDGWVASQPAAPRSAGCASLRRLTRPGPACTNFPSCLPPQCYNNPRIENEPCSLAGVTGETCSEGLACRPDTLRCAAKGGMGALCFEG